MSNFQFKLIQVVVIGTLLLLGSPAAAKKIKIASALGSQYLFPKELQNLKKEKCAFFHVWATWCSICMEEMPDLIKMLKNVKKVRPIIVDVSSISVQNSFSKRWMQQLRPSFPTYLKPDIKDEVYLEAVDSSFSGTLPFSALFKKGKLQKKWTGQLDLKNLSAEFQNLCD